MKEAFNYRRRTIRRFEMTSREVSNPNKDPTNETRLVALCSGGSLSVRLRLSHGIEDSTVFMVGQKFRWLCRTPMSSVTLKSHEHCYTAILHAI